MRIDELIKDLNDPDEIDPKTFKEENQIVLAELISTWPDTLEKSELKLALLEAFVKRGKSDEMEFNQILKNHGLS